MEKPMSRTDELNKAFRKLQGDLRGVEAYATVPSPAAPRTAHTMEKSMSRTDELNRALRKFQEDSPGVEACALVSDDGLTIASILPVGMEETRVGGMGATLLSLATRASVQLNRGVVREVVVRGEGGYVVMIGTRRNALLMAVTNEASKLGMIFFDMHEAIRAIEKIL
jgi:predicted regulator of Ras-like GTPase activity (Roadblock/LC7/MglB family)